MGVDMTEGTNVVKMGVANDGLTIVAREDGGALVYDFTAAKLDVDLTSPTKAIPGMPSSRPR